MTRAALMARVSSEDQVGDAKLSIPAQLREMRAFCKRQRWAVVLEYADEVHESAYTHDINARPKLKRALTDGLEGKYDVLVVPEMTRFARNVELAQTVQRMLRSAGIRIVDMTSPDVDANTADGAFFTVIKQGTGEWWSSKISEATKRVKREAFARGLHLGDPPFGYRRVEPGRPYELVVDEAEAIREGFRDYVAGASYTEVAARWNAVGLRPRSKQGHTRFTVPAMQSIFENDFYAGFVRYKGERRAGSHTPIIDEALWLQAQTRVRRMAPRTRQPRMLSGIARCGGCQGPLWLTNHGRRGSPIHYYREPSKERGRSCPNAQSMWRAEMAEAQVSKVVETMSADPRWLRRIDHDARRAPAADASEREALLAEKRRLVEAYAVAADVMPASEFRERVRGIDQRLARLPVASPEAVMFAGEKLLSVGQVWEAMTTGEQQQACRLLFEEVVMDTREKRLWLRPWAEFAPHFEARRAVVCRLGPPGFEPWVHTTDSGLFAVTELVA